MALTHQTPQKKTPPLDILVTRRMTLRPPLEVDAESIAEIMQNTNITRMLTRPPQPYGLDDAKNWIAAHQAKRDEPCFTIYRQKLMGVVSIETKDRGPELGYWLDETHWGQGYMTEAARAVLSHSFNRLDVDEIVSGAFADNPASRKVLEKLGFEFEGQKQAYCNARKAEVTIDLAALSRERFENLFGSSEENVAA